MILITRTTHHAQQRGHTLSTSTVLTVLSTFFVLPSLLPCHSIDYLGRQLLNEPFLVYVFSLFQPKSASFPTSRLQLLCGFLRFLTSSPPSPLSSSFPSRSPPHLSSHLNYCSRFRPRSCPRSILVLVHGVSIPVPALVSARSPLPSPSISYLRSFATTPVLVPAPSPAPSPSTSPFTSSLLQPPTPFPSSIPPQTHIPSPAPFAHSFLLDSVTPLVRCAGTSTGPCQRSCRVPASATPCL